LSETSLKSTDDPWPIVKHMMLYDPFAAVAAMPRYRHIYYDPHIITVRDTKHRIIGMSNKNHNIKYPRALLGFITSQMVEALDIYQQYMMAA